MHPNPAFRQTPLARNLDFARTRGFGALVVNGPMGPILAHIPFLLSPDGSFADFHLARSNAVIQNGVPAGAVLAVTGPDAYISPDWYGMADQVPTWNYVAVHLRGTVHPLPEDTLEPHLNAISDMFEARLAPKPIWRSTKMAKGVMPRMMRMILPCRLQIATVDGTWKLGQNKPDAARLAAAEALGDSDLARLMKEI
jgi:transcriptional regulator